MPKKVAMVGGGYIAVELAGVFKALGADVTIIIRQDQFLRHFDDIIRQTVMEEYEKMGIKVVKCATISKVENTGTSDKKNLKLHLKTSSGLSELDGFEELIWAIGREANTEPLNLQSTGVQSNKNGFIVADEYQQTNVPGIFALGDVCGVAMLTPVAIAAARKLSDRLFGGHAGAKLDYSNIPSVIFSHPPCGSIGLTEQEARTKHGDDNIKIYKSKVLVSSFC